MHLSHAHEHWHLPYREAFLRKGPQEISESVRLLLRNSGMTDDRAIHETALTVLRSTGYAALARLECRVDERVLALSGVVESYYLKQLAQEALKRIGPIKRIENNLGVVSKATRPATG